MGHIRISTVAPPRLRENDRWRHFEDPRTRQDAWIPRYAASVDDDRSVTFLVVKDGKGHRVVAPLVGDTVAELESRAIAAVDAALDGHVARSGFTGHIIVAFESLPAQDVEVERVRIQRSLQARADAFGGVTVLGRPLRVEVTIGLVDREPTPAAAGDEDHVATPSVDRPLAPGGAPFAQFFEQGFVVRDQQGRDAFRATVFVTVGWALLCVALWSGDQPLVVLALFAAVLCALVLVVVRQARGRVLRLYSDRLEISAMRTRTIAFADVDAFMFATAPIPGNFILTKKSLLVRYRRSRGGALMGMDGELYDEAIEGDFVPLGAMALAVVLNFRLQRWREKQT
jgi:hypothetical protein